MKHIFIVNPVAGKGKALKFVGKIKSNVRSVTRDYAIRITRHPGHGTEIAQEYAGLENLRLYSVGGDGTLNEIVNGIAESKTPLGIIPAGAGNDFARMLYSIKNLDIITRSLLTGIVKPIDMVKVNSDYFVNVSSVGFDADVAYNSNHLRKLLFVPGSFSYYLSIFTTLIKNKSHKLDIEIDGALKSSNYLLATVANGKYYGGGMIPAPAAVIDDGILDICTVESKSRIEILKLFSRYIKGKHATIPGVSFYKGNSIKISSAGPISLNLDGEVKRIKNVQYKIIPGGLNIICPDT